MPTHNYTVGGRYVVELTVVDETGVRGVWTETLNLPHPVTTLQGVSVPGRPYQGDALQAGDHSRSASIRFLQMS